MTAKDLTEFSNHVLEIYLQEITDSKIIDKEIAEKLKDYRVIIAERSFFGKLWNAILFKSGTDTKIVVVKILKNNFSEKSGN